MLRFLIISLLSCSALGCANTTAITLYDSTTIVGHVETSDEHSVHLRNPHDETERIAIDREQIAFAEHPGRPQIGTGLALSFVALVGNTVMGAMFTGSNEPYCDSVTGSCYDEGEGAEFGVVIGLPVMMPITTAGAALLFRGLALRRESQLQLSTDDRALVGRAHTRLGRRLLGAGITMLGMLYPAIRYENSPVGGVGWALLGYAPALVIPGIALLIRGAHMRRQSADSRRVRWTGDGLRFDLSL